MLARKTLNRVEWKALGKKKIKTVPVNNSIFDGVISLMEFYDIKDDVKIPSGLVIAKNGYSWLHIAPKNQNWWLTSMFDENGKLFQSYFDLTLENDFTDEKNPSFIDAKLDLVIDSNDNLLILDRDEFDLALRLNEINENDYNKINNTLDSIISFYRSNKDLFYSYLNEYYKKLKL